MEAAVAVAWNGFVLLNTRELEVEGSSGSGLLRKSDVLVAVAVVVARNGFEFVLLNKSDLEVEGSLEGGVAWDKFVLLNTCELEVEGGSGSGLLRKSDFLGIILLYFLLVAVACDKFEFLFLSVDGVSIL